MTILLVTRVILKYAAIEDAHNFSHLCLSAINQDSVNISNNLILLFRSDWSFGQCVY